MSDNLISRFLGGARRRTSPDTSRRQFFRRAAVGATAPVGALPAAPDDAWAAIEERAARFGIVPGTVVDAQGRPAPELEGQDVYVGEVILFGGNFAIRGYAMCQGQLLPIAENTALFSILGTVYGGDGRTTFALPDLRGRTALGAGTGPGLTPVALGQRGGADQVTMTAATMPSHQHGVPVFNAPGSARTPSGNILAGDTTGDTIYAPASQANAALAATNATGGGQSFNPRSPSLAMNYLIALQGIYPSRT